MMQPIICVRVFLLLPSFIFEFIKFAVQAIKGIEMIAMMIATYSLQSFPTPLHAIIVVYARLHAWVPCDGKVSVHL